MKSIQQKVQQVCGLAGTSDVSEWESNFLTSIDERTDGGRNCGALTEKQIEIIERIFSKHFA